MKTALEGMGIEVLEGRVDQEEPDSDGNVATRDGKTIEGVDLILNAAGFTYAGDALADDTLQKDLTKRGQFDCRHALQLQSTDSVICCGDILLSTPEGYYADVKGLLHANDTAATVGKNVVLQLQGKVLQDLKWSKTPIGGSWICRYAQLYGELHGTILQM
jgi:hypothetical protein